MITIGLTGGISAGKTTVSEILEDKGIPIFNSDKVAREAEEDPEMREKFLDIIGHDIVVDGQIDRHKMRTRVFGDKAMLSKVNQLITPYVVTRFGKFVQEQEALGQDMVVLESAILLGTSTSKAFNFIISVIADKLTRAKRTMARDNVTLDLVLKKFDAQLSDNEMIQRSDFIIVNEDCPFTYRTLLLEKQINTILTLIMFSK